MARPILFLHTPSLLLLISSTHETYSFPLCRLIRRIYGALIQSASSSVFYRKRKEKKKGRGKTFIILTPVRKPNLVIQRYFSSELTVSLGRRTRYFIVVQCGFKILNQHENFVLPLHSCTFEWDKIDDRKEGFESMIFLIFVYFFVYSFLHSVSGLVRLIKISKNLIFL